MIITYDISELIPYINWPYFFFAWQVKEQSEKDRLRQEAEAFLQQLEGEYHAYGLFELFDAHSDGDDIVVGKKGDRSQESGVSRIPCLRQQQGNPPYLCLSDFLPPHIISTDSCLLTPWRFRHFRLPWPRNGLRLRPLPENDGPAPCRPSR